MNSDGDEDLARAIALSLQDVIVPPREVIDIISSDSENDSDEKVNNVFRRPPTSSSLSSSKKQQQRPQPTSRRKRPPMVTQPLKDVVKQAVPAAQASSSSTTLPSMHPPSSSFLAQRAQLEKERLQRQKRLRPEAQVIDVDDDVTDEEDASDGPPGKRQRLSSSSASRLNDVPNRAAPSSSTKGKKPQSQTVVPGLATNNQYFWDGELRQTANYHAQPRRDGQATFRLTEILGEKTEISFAILSSFALDIAWIYRFFDPSTPVVMVAQPDANGQVSLKNILPNWLRTTPYLRGGRGCMHMKFMLLFYKSGRLRVVVSTANLIDYDYRDMENTVWLQDIPLRGKPIPHDPKATEDFPSIMQWVLFRLNVDPAIKNMLGDKHPNLPIHSIEELGTLWDWSRVKVQLVASISGTHEGWPKVIRTGHPRLMKVLRDLRLNTGKGHGAKRVSLECQGSSLGIYTTQWLNEFYHSARGESAENWLDEPRKRREKLPYPPIKIIYPTKATVQQTQLGEAGGGTLFCRRKQWAAKNFPRDHFYDSKSKGGPVLMHSKMIIATFGDVPSSSSRQNKDDEGPDIDHDEIQVTTRAIGWAYVGSHNFTPSAWGTLSGTGFNPVLNITNYELGIVFPLQDAEEADRLACFERPPRKYTARDEPWIQEESVYHQGAQ